jgi:hypothetical protein
MAVPLSMAIERLDYFGFGAEDLGLVPLHGHPIKLIRRSDCTVTGNFGAKPKGFDPELSQHD